MKIFLPRSYENVCMLKVLDYHENFERSCREETLPIGFVKIHETLRIYN